MLRWNVSILVPLTTTFKKKSLPKKNLQGFHPTTTGASSLQEKNRSTPTTRFTATYMLYHARAKAFNPLLLPSLALDVDTSDEANRRVTNAFRLAWVVRRVASVDTRRNIMVVVGNNAKVGYDGGGGRTTSVVAVQQLPPTRKHSKCYSGS